MMLDETWDRRLFIHSFIHSGHCYRAPLSPLLLRDAPDHSTDTVSGFHAEAHRQLQIKNMPKVPTWRLERESNPRPSGWKSSSKPRRHHVPQFHLVVSKVSPRSRLRDFYGQSVGNSVATGV